NSEPQPIPQIASAAFERASSAWHRAELAKCEEAAQWPASAFHLGRLLQIAPMPARYYSERELAVEQLKSDEQATMAYARAFESGAKNPSALHCAALLWLYAGCHDEYRRICDSLLTQIQDTSNAGRVNSCVWTCILGDQAVADLSRVAALQHEAVTG